MTRVTITEPTPGGDTDDWGDKLNTALTALAATINGLGTAADHPAADFSTWLSVLDARIGAVADGATDNGPSGLAVLTNAVSILGSTGGTIYFPPGTYQFLSQPPTLPSNVRIVGAGKNATILRKAYTGAGLLRFEGTSTSSRVQRGGVADLQLAGDGSHTGALLTATYADHLNFDRVWFNNNADCAVVATELWDTYFDGCEFEYCGTTTNRTGAAVRLLSSATDSTNEIYFSQCRWESFPGNAVFIDSNSSSHPPYGIWFSQCKMETAFVHNWLNFLDVTSDVTDVHIRDLYVAADALASGGTATGSLIGFTAFANMTIDGLHVHIAGGAATGVLYVWPGAVGHSIRNVYVDSASLASGIINFAGGNPTLRIGNVGYASGTGTKYAGTTPSNVVVDENDGVGNGDRAVRRSGSIVETVTRRMVSSSTLASPASGVLYAAAVGLQAGQVVSSITFLSGTTALATGTHQWFALLDSTGTVVAVTADNTSGAWAASAEKTLALTAAYTVPATGVYYLAKMVAATTVPTMHGAAMVTATVAGLAPMIAATAGSGLTTPPSLGTAFTLAANASLCYAYAS